MKRKISLFLILTLLLAMLPARVYAAGTLKYGMNGENVKKVQTRLSELEYYFGNINGKFNRQTENAVKKFQAANGLKVTGEVNAETRKKLESGSALSRSQAEARKKGTGQSAKPQATVKPQTTAKPKATVKPQATAAPGQGSGTLKYGTTNADVKAAQERLKELGYFTETADGKYDAGTREAVALFLKANGMTGNGNALTAAARKKLAASDAVSKSTYDATCAVGTGDTGYAVKLVQTRLRELGYYTGKVSGKYTSATAAAVKKFQSANGLTVTGNCDYNTRKVMNSDGAKAYRKAAATATPKATAAPTAAVKPTPTPAATKAPVQTTPAPAATTKPAPTPTQKPSDGRAEKIETVITAAQAQLGKPYIFATSGMKSFDCSGLTMYAFSLVGINLSHSARSQGYQNLTRLTAEQLERGDLMVFNTNTTDGDQADHVGIYLGNGTFIHASSARGMVYISTLAEYKKWFSWGLRLIK